MTKMVEVEGSEKLGKTEIFPTRKEFLIPEVIKICSNGKNLHVRYHGINLGIYA